MMQLCCFRPNRSLSSPEAGSPSQPASPTTEECSSSKRAPCSGPKNGHCLASISHIQKQEAKEAPVASICGVQVQLVVDEGDGQPNIHLHITACDEQVVLDQPVYALGEQGMPMHVKHSNSKALTAGSSTNKQLVPQNGTAVAAQEICRQLLAQQVDSTWSSSSSLVGNGHNEATESSSIRSASAELRPATPTVEITPAETPVDAAGQGAHTAHAETAEQAAQKEQHCCLEQLPNPEDEFAGATLRQWVDYNPSGEAATLRQWVDRTPSNETSEVREKEQPTAAAGSSQSAIDGRTSSSGLDWDSSSMPAAGSIGSVHAQEPCVWERVLSSTRLQQLLEIRGAGAAAETAAETAGPRTPVEDAAAAATGAGASCNEGNPLAELEQCFEQHATAEAAAAEAAAADAAASAVHSPEDVLLLFEASQSGPAAAAAARPSAAAAAGQQGPGMLSCSTSRVSRVSLCSTPSSRHRSSLTNGHLLPLSAGGAATPKQGRISITDKLLVQLGEVAAASVMLQQQQQEARAALSAMDGAISSSAASIGGSTGSPRSPAYRQGQRAAASFSSGGAPLPAVGVGAGMPYRRRGMSNIDTIAGELSAQQLLLGLDRHSSPGGLPAGASCSHMDPFIRSSTSGISNSSYISRGSSEVLSAAARARLLRQVSAALAAGISLDDLLQQCDEANKYSSRATEKQLTMQQGLLGTWSTPRGYGRVHSSRSGIGSCRLTTSRNGSSGSQQLAAAAAAGISSSRAVVHCASSGGGSSWCSASEGDETLVAEAVAQQNGQQQVHQQQGQASQSPKPLSASGSAWKSLEDQWETLRSQWQRQQQQQSTGSGNNSTASPNQQQHLQEQQERQQQQKGIAELSSGAWLQEAVRDISSSSTWDSYSTCPRYSSAAGAQEVVAQDNALLMMNSTYSNELCSRSTGGGSSRVSDASSCAGAVVAVSSLRPEEQQQSGQAGTAAAGGTGQYQNVTTIVWPDSTGASRAPSTAGAAPAAAGDNAAAAEAATSAADGTDGASSSTLAAAGDVGSPSPLAVASRSTSLPLSPSSSSWTSSNTSNRRSSAARASSTSPAKPRWCGNCNVGYSAAAAAAAATAAAAEARGLCQAWPRVSTRVHYCPACNPDGACGVAGRPARACVRYSSADDSRRGRTSSPQGRTSVGSLGLDEALTQATAAAGSGAAAAAAGASSRLSPRGSMLSPRESKASPRGNEVSPSGSRVSPRCGVDSYAAASQQRAAAASPPLKRVTRQSGNAGSGANNNREGVSQAAAVAAPAADPANQILVSADFREVEPTTATPQPPPAAAAAGDGQAEVAEPAAKPAVAAAAAVAPAAAAASSAAGSIKSSRQTSAAATPKAAPAEVSSAASAAAIQALPAAAAGSTAKGDKAAPSASSSLTSSLTRARSSAPAALAATSTTASSSSGRWGLVPDRRPADLATAAAAVTAVAATSAKPARGSQVMIGLCSKGEPAATTTSSNSSSTGLNSNMLTRPLAAGSSSSSSKQSAAAAGNQQESPRKPTNASSLSRTVPATAAAAGKPSTATGNPSTAGGSAVGSSLSLPNLNLKPIKVKTAPAVLSPASSSSGSEAGSHGPRSGIMSPQSPLSPKTGSSDGQSVRDSGLWDNIGAADSRQQATQQQISAAITQLGRQQQQQNALPPKRVPGRSPARKLPAGAGAAASVGAAAAAAASRSSGAVSQLSAWKLPDHNRSASLAAPARCSAAVTGAKRSSSPAAAAPATAVASAGTGGGASVSSSKLARVAAAGSNSKSTAAVSPAALGKQSAATAATSARLSAGVASSGGGSNSSTARNRATVPLAQGRTAGLQFTTNSSSGSGSGSSAGKSSATSSSGGGSSGSRLKPRASSCSPVRLPAGSRAAPEAMLRPSTSPPHIPAANLACRTSEQPATLAAVAANKCAPASTATPADGSRSSSKTSKQQAASISPVRMTAVRSGDKEGGKPSMALNIPVYVQAGEVTPLRTSPRGALASPKSSPRGVLTPATTSGSSSGKVSSSGAAAGSVSSSGGLHAIHWASEVVASVQTFNPADPPVVKGALTTSGRAGSHAPAWLLKHHGATEHAGAAVRDAAAEHCAAGSSSGATSTAAAALQLQSSPDHHYHQQQQQQHKLGVRSAAPFSAAELSQQQPEATSTSTSAAAAGCAAAAPARTHRVTFQDDTSLGIISIPSPSLVWEQGSKSRQLHSCPAVPRDGVSEGFMWAGSAGAAEPGDGGIVPGAAAAGAVADGLTGILALVKQLQGNLAGLESDMQQLHGVLHRPSSTADGGSVVMGQRRGSMRSELLSEGGDDEGVGLASSSMARLHSSSPLPHSSRAGTADGGLWTVSEVAEGGPYAELLDSAAAAAAAAARDYGGHSNAGASAIDGEGVDEDGEGGEPVRCVTPLSSVVLQIRGLGGKGGDGPGSPAAATQALHDWVERQCQLDASCRLLRKSSAGGAAAAEAAPAATAGVVVAQRVQLLEGMEGRQQGVAGLQFHTSAAEGGGGQEWQCQQQLLQGRPFGQGVEQQVQQVEGEGTEGLAGCVQGQPLGEGVEDGGQSEAGDARHMTLATLASWALPCDAFVSESGSEISLV